MNHILPKNIDLDNFIDYLSQFITENRLDRIKEVASKRTRYFSVVLENIYQSHNASAVLRSCDCFGIQNVCVVENINKFEPNVEIALGAEKWLDIETFTGDDAINLCYDNLRKQGYKIAATTPHYNPILIDDLPIDNPVALIFGTEKNGLSDTAIENADFKVALPMLGFTESFNISVSAAIFMSKLIDKSNFQKQNIFISSDEQKELIAQWILNTVKDPNGLINNYLDKF